MARDGINRRGIERFTRDLQKEFDKHPIYVPVQVPDASASTVQPPVVNYNYNGPVFHGDATGAQLAWANSGEVQQNQGDRTEAVSSGFEAIAAAVADVLRGLPSAALDEDARADAEGCAEDVLAEVTKTEPDRSIVRRAVSALQGFLLRAATGMADGAVEGSQEWAQHAIASLNAPF